MTAKQEKDCALAAAGSVAIDLRVVLRDARNKLDAFEEFIDGWDEDVAASGYDADSKDPRRLTQRHVITRALEQLEAVAHIHTGSTHMMNLRTAQERLVQLAKCTSDTGTV